MSTFVLACDESWGKRDLGYFYRTGLMAPEPDWAEFFEPAWQERVLAGPPAIPFLHMIDIYNQDWRDRHGIGRLSADDRVGAAIDVVSTLGSIFALSGRIPGDHANAAFEDVKVELGPNEDCDFDPEFPLFSSFVIGALQIANELGCTKLDTLIENGPLATRLLRFAGSIGSSLIGTPEEHLAPLIGTFVVAGKENVRLQAADLVCWFTQRGASGLANQQQQERIERLAKLHGTRFQWTTSDIDSMRERARLQAKPAPGISSK